VSAPSRVSTVRVELRGPLGAALGVLAATAVVAVVDPNTTHVPLCPFHAATGWWCPLCGGLRAVYALTHGHLSTALHDNLLFVLMSPVLVALWADWAYRTSAGRPTRRLPRAAWPVLAGVAVVFTVLRNMPGLGWLAP
jgi:hypothetical protein